jgi:hypothetical protein
MIELLARGADKSASGQPLNRSSTTGPSDVAHIVGTSR